MHGDDTIGAQVTQVGLEGLAREEVDGNGVAAESVEREQVEALALAAGDLAFHHHPRVAHDHVDLALRVIEVAEVLPREFIDVWIDLVDPQVVALSRVGGERPRAETHKSDAAGRLRQLVDRKAHAAGVGVIGRGYHRLVGPDELDPVGRRAVQQQVVVLLLIVGVVIDDLERAVEIAGGAEDLVAAPVLPVDDEDRAEPHAERHDETREPRLPLRGEPKPAEVEGARQERRHARREVGPAVASELEVLRAEAEAAVERGAQPRQHRDDSHRTDRGRQPDLATAMPEAQHAEQVAQEPQAELQLTVVAEDRGRDDRDEEAAQRAAERDEHEIGGEPGGGGFEPVEFAVADHAGEEQHDVVGDDLQAHRHVGTRRQDLRRDRHADDQERGEHPPVIPAGVVEADDEGQQIEGEREDPEERDDRDFLAELVGGREEQHRRDHGQHDPQETVGGGRRRLLRGRRIRRGAGRVTRPPGRRRPAPKDPRADAAEHREEGEAG